MVALAAAAWALAWRRGGVEAPDWLPAAVLAAAFLATLGFAGAIRRPDRLAAVGIAALVALAAWQAASIMWAPIPSLARDEALLTLLYATTLAVTVKTLRTPGGRIAALAALVMAAATLAVATAVRLLLAGEIGDIYAFGRLNFPIAYANAQAAAFLLPFWPALAFAARRVFPVVARSLALGGAIALLGGWLLTQSKGAAVALVLSGVVVFAVARERVRLLVPTLVAVAGVTAAFGPLTKPFRVDGQPQFLLAVNDAGFTILALFAGGCIVGAVYAAADRWLTVPRRLVRTTGGVALAALAGGLALGLALFLTRVDDPGGYLASKFEEFKHSPAQETGSSHLVTLGSNRWDFWRVSLDEFHDHPVRGVGARGFGPVYLIQGRSYQTPLRAHSVELDALGETGLPGLLLLLVGVGAPLASVAWRSRRGLGAAALLGGACYWLLHASADWNWTFPATGLPFFLLLGIGASADEAAATARRSVALATGIVGVLLALLAFAPPWLSNRFVGRAYDAGPGAGGRSLRLARAFDPLSLEPLTAESALATDADGRIDPLVEAVRRVPESAGLHATLADAYLAAGRREDAVRELRRARELSPRDPLLEAELGAAERGG